MAEQERIGGWEENRRRKLVIGLEATVEQRLDWLQEMLAIAHATGALPRRRDYVIPLDGAIVCAGAPARITLDSASFISSREGELSFSAGWSDGEERWSLQLQGLEEERFSGRMERAPPRAGRSMPVSVTRIRVAPGEWELRGTLGAEGGELRLSLAEKRYR